MRALAIFVACCALASGGGARAAETCVAFDGSRLDLSATNQIRLCAPWADALGAALDPAKAEIQKCEATATYGAGLVETVTIQGSSPLPPGAISTATFAKAYTVAGDTNDTLVVRCLGVADKTIVGVPAAWATTAAQPATFRPVPGLGLPGRAVAVP